MVWDADRAQDLAQEAFARALGQTPDNPRAWVFRVASNLAQDEARSAIRRRKHLVLIKGEAETQQAVPDPQDQLEQQERLDAVRRSLARLSDRDREALLLWNAGLNYHDIAAATGLSASAVGTTLARARRRLVEAYDELERRHVAR